jgi:hypothetical protein
MHHYCMKNHMYRLRASPESLVKLSGTGIIWKISLNLRSNSQCIRLAKALPLLDTFREPTPLAISHRLPARRAPSLALTLPPPPFRRRPPAIATCSPPAVAGQQRHGSHRRSRWRWPARSRGGPAPSVDSPASEPRRSIPRGSSAATTSPTSLGLHLASDLSTTRRR